MMARDSSMVRAWPRIRSNNAVARSTTAGSVVVGSSIVTFTKVSGIAWPLAIIAVWLAVAWVAKSISLRRRRQRPEEREVTARE